MSEKLMAKDVKFLFELGAEELPAGQISAISEYILGKMLEALENAEISYSESQALYSPRRLFWEISGLNLEAQDKEIEIKGPPEKIAKSEDGSFTQAALGFAKKNDLKESDLNFVDGYLFAKKTIKGQSPKSVLEAALPEIIASTPGIRFMRWADGDLKFARPLQWIMACFEGDKSILEFEIEGLKADNKTYGHRFLGPEAIEIKSTKDYLQKLEKQGVTVDPKARENKILEESQKLADSLGATIVPEQDLLDEVVLITENPSPVLCEFDKKFLEIPDCVLKTVMIHHQRYIPIEKDGKLIPYFIAVSNNPLKSARENIKEGNEKVIVPRFKDAEFFVSEDTKQSLNDRFVKLEKLNSMKGTMQEKAERLQAIVEYLAKEIKPNYAANPEASGSLDDLESIKLAAKLCKADLTSNLVFEFTELQGEIGGIYAQKEGLNEVVSQAISEHYRPRFADDEAPTTIAGKILAIADKLDNIVSAFALGKIPSGSADPFALRRQANGMLEIIVHSHLILDLDALVDFVIKLQRDQFGDGELITKMKGRGKDRKEVQVKELNWDGVDKLIKEFVESRLAFVFEIYHKDKEINKAVLSYGNPLTELNKRHMMIHCLYQLKESEGFSSLVEAVTRIKNIAKDIDSLEVDEALFETDYERQFYEHIKPLTVCETQNESYSPVLDSEQLLKVVKPINEFFDNVLVNAEDEKIRSNRKALVGYANSVFIQIGDFSLL